ncbi:hypothetical protein Ade02nite_21100 [Paractinoplanes deccanensis]|uniref:Uncharacterized protein n=1 Tax=Paractinoplanes deccanensis TaxID=113561 RepID=A0ABQ3Y0F8_9ACTN|nr:hypothetical protein [Actinoplanes deccanensis]GID73469.1 hypothetical protein Ade02nite_21100 [Actinoplanes deccanensis]
MSDDPQHPSPVRQWPAPDGPRQVWMLDLDEDDRPILAHAVAGTERGGQVTITACGRRETAESHPRGWWNLRPGELPLADHAIHCSPQRH